MEAPIGEIVLDPFDSPWRPVAHAPAAGTQEPETAPETDTAPTAGAADDRVSLLKAQEIAWLREALTAANFNQRRAAELLSLTYHQLRGYIKKYQLLDRDTDD